MVPPFVDWMLVRFGKVAACALYIRNMLCWPTMKPHDSVSRRVFLGTAAVASLTPVALAAKRYPIGLELYSVRNQLQKDLKGTVTAVAKMGYEVVEFYSPYFSWTPDYAKEIRKLLNDLGIRCLSTHNGAESFTPEKISHPSS